jgi:putative endonuclease
MGSPPLTEPGRRGLGLAGEERAARHLASHGLNVLLRNWRCRMGELDLVALDGNVLVIVEVRHRVRGDYGGAAASITHAKRRRIVRATRHLLMRRPDLARLPARFDVIALDGPEGRIDWIRGAFDAG